MEVFKGPESSLYGSGIAGVVKLYSIQPKPNTTKILEENTVGSYGLYRNNTRIESAGSNSVLFLITAIKRQMVTVAIVHQQKITLPLKAIFM